MTDYIELFNKQEDLCPELAACHYLDTSLMTHVIKHPLLIEIFHIPQMNAMANMRLQEKRRLVEEKAAEQKWEGVLVLHERPFRFEAFKRLIATHKIPIK